MINLSLDLHVKINLYDSRDVTSEEVFRPLQSTEKQSEEIRTSKSLRRLVKEQVTVIIFYGEDIKSPFSC